MKYKFINLVTLCSLLPIVTSAYELERVSVHGYGTLGVAFQDNKDVLYRNSLNMDKGSQGDFSLANYSSFGLQLDIKATDNLSLTAQSVVSEKNSNGKLIELGWLNAKYDLSDTLSVRVGKMRLPAFMSSDIVDVAYSYDWMRLPDMYSIMPVNNYVGIEFNHEVAFDKFSIMSTFLYGQGKSVIYNSSNEGTIKKSDIEIKRIYGLAFKLLSDDVTFRLAYYGDVQFTLKNQEMDNVLAGLNSLGVPSVNQAINKYKINEAPLEYFAIGGKYDFKNMYLLAEYIEMNTDTFLADNTSWYVGSGYNFENWSPFILYSRVKSTQNYKDIPIQEGSPMEIIGLITGVNQALRGISESMTNMELDTVSLGFRYNLSENSVFKFQYDKQKELKKNRVNFHFSNDTSADLDVFSAAVNFTF